MKDENEKCNVFNLMFIWNADDVMIPNETLVTVAKQKHVVDNGNFEEVALERGRHGTHIKSSELRKKRSE